MYTLLANYFQHSIVSVCSYISNNSSNLADCECCDVFYDLTKKQLPGNIFFPVPRPLEESVTPRVKFRGGFFLPFIMWLP